MFFKNKNFFHALVFTWALILTTIPAIWAQELVFKRPCPEGSKVTIGATGDILFHMALQVQAKRNKSYEHNWNRIQAALDEADIMYGNLESPIAPGVCQERTTDTLGNCQEDPRYSKFGGYYKWLMKNGFSNTPRINVEADLLHDLANSFDVLSTANNHAMDRGVLGVDLTIENLHAAGFKNKYTGTISSSSSISYNEEDNDLQWHAEAQMNGIKIAFVACTFHTNFINEKSKQVLKCYKNLKSKVPNPQYLRIIKKLSRKYDAVIATPHWGKEYTKKVSKERKELTMKIFKNGALAVLGAHPHVVQEMKIISSFRDDLNQMKDRFVIYSLGNFIANQGGGSDSKKDIKKRTGIILYLSLNKHMGKTTMTSVEYYPFYITTSSLGPERLRMPLGYEDSFIQKGTRLEKHILLSKKYLHKILPIENMRGNSLKECD